MINVFSVGVHIGMTTNATQVLASMLTQLTGVHVAAGNLTSQLGKMRTVALGAGAAFAGWEALKVMTHILEKGIAFNQELAKMKMANIPQADIDRLETQSYSTMKNVPGSNLVDNIKRTADLRNISGATGHVEFLSDLAAKTDLVLSNITGKEAEGQGFKFAKFLEDSGRTTDPKTGQFSEERISQQYHWMQGVIAQTRGKVSGDDMFQFRQSGKASVNALSDEGLTKTVPIIYSLGPVAAGAGIQAMSQQLLGSVQLYKHTIDWLEQYHLVDPKKVIKQKGGRFSLAPGAITGEKELQNDKIGWIWDVLSPNMKRKDGTAMTAQEKVSELLRSGLRTPMQGLMSEAIQNETPQKKDVEFIKNAQKIDTFKKMDEESPTFRITKFTEAWNNLLIALGKSVDVTQFLVPLTSILNRLNEAAVNHPEAVKYLFFLAGGIAALTAVGGSIVVFTTAIGPFVAALKLLTGLTRLAATGTAINGVGTALGGLAAQGTAIGGLTTGLGGLASTLGLFAVGGAAIVGIDLLMGKLHDLGQFGNKEGFTPMQGGPQQGAAPVWHGPDTRPQGVAPMPGDKDFRIQVVPPPASKETGQRSGDIYLDGKKVGMILDNHTADRFSRPPTGRMGADGRVSPMMPGLSSAFG